MRQRMHTGNSKDDAEFESLTPLLPLYRELRVGLRNIAIVQMG
jgi:hypothetical protein